MLGNIVVEEVGTAMEMTDLGDNKVEIKLATEGTVKGVDQTSAWTYWMETRADGSIHGEGHGVMTTADGDVINLRGMGACPGAGADGSVAWRGSILLFTDAEAFADLNGTAMVFHYDVTADGGTKTTAWGWN